MTDFQYPEMTATLTAREETYRLTVQHAGRTFQVVLSSTPAGVASLVNGGVVSNGLLFGDIDAAWTAAAQFITDTSRLHIQEIGEGTAYPAVLEVGQTVQPAASSAPPFSLTPDERALGFRAVEISDMSGLHADSGDAT